MGSTTTIATSTDIEYFSIVWIGNKSVKYIALLSLKDGYTAVRYDGSEAKNGTIAAEEGYSKRLCKKNLLKRFKRAYKYIRKD